MENQSTYNESTEAPRHTLVEVAPSLPKREILCLTRAASLQKRLEKKGVRVERNRESKEESRKKKEWNKKNHKACYTMIKCESLCNENINTAHYSAFCKLILGLVKMQLCVLDNFLFVCTVCVPILVLKCSYCHTKLSYSNSNTS